MLPVVNDPNWPVTAKSQATYDGTAFDQGNCCTSVPVKPLTATHAQVTVVIMVLRVPNVCGSPLFFENREQKRIERWGNGRNSRRAVGSVAHAEWARTPRGVRKDQK